jgi:hypothetical protein
VFDLEYFKTITDYRDCDENNSTVKLFWKVLESFTNAEREQYLRFVWGRTRLPLKEMDTLMRHMIQLEKNKTEQHFPHGKTCYFQLILPVYHNETVLKEKLLYAQTNCLQMNLDFESIREAPDGNEEE